MHRLFLLTFRKAICQCEMSKRDIIISLCIIKGCIDKLSDWPSTKRPALLGTPVSATPYPINGLVTFVHAM